MKTVAITGVGVCVPGHLKLASLYDALYRGQSLLRKQVLDVAHGRRTQVCSSLGSDQLASIQHFYPALQRPGISKATSMGVYAAHEAVKHAGLQKLDDDRTGLFLGCNKTIVDIATHYSVWQAAKNGSSSPEHEHELALLRPNQCAEMVAQQLQFSGLQMTFGDACTAGAIAIISGMRRIQHGELDVAICGAAEHATHPLMQLAFAKLGALSLNANDDATAVCRPFDKDRSGCLLADASAFLILESEEHARARGQKPLAVLRAGVRQTEAHKFTSTAADGSYYAKCMQRALDVAAMESREIDHINAHGTSTPSNDRAESRAINNLFLHQPSVTSTKSALGHSLGASGAVEAALCVESLVRQQVLPTLNFDQPGVDEPQLNIVRQGGEQVLNNIMSNSFGFGGENASLIFSKANNSEQGA